jgi:NAD(P)-dependent dehydrogenase (short-subunit alcohol dehydrogenase family)
MSTFDVNLRGVVAAVTGASRGAGRGTALVLGEAGATVYVTARSVRGAPSAPGREGSVEETAEAVAKRGGIGIPVVCDHADDDAVRSLFERIRNEQGRLDVLVNNAWGGYEQRPGEPEVGFFGVPFWEQPLWRWDAMFTSGVRAHFLASQHAAPHLVASRDARPGLIVSTIAWAYGAYLGNVLYDTAKAATARMAFGMAEDLRTHRVASVALAPGHLGVDETPEYLGRAIATLAADADVMARTGALLTVGELARDYGFTDVDGTQPEPFGLPKTSSRDAGPGAQPRSDIGGRDGE